MKIQIISDTHFPARPRPIALYDVEIDKTADVLVAAGDISQFDYGCHYLLNCGFSGEIIYVPGNHEYYHTVMPEIKEKALAMTKDTHVHVLMNEVKVINGIYFVGSTLWTDYKLFNTPEIAMKMSARALNDHFFILNHPKEIWMPQHALEEHKSSINWLTETLKITPSKKTVVVTHHAPSIRSVANKWLNDPISPAFASDLESIIFKHQPRFWIHGHTHTRFHYTLDKTEVICHPKGYPGELGAYSVKTIRIPT